jgi:serine/threonine protein kinase
MEYCQNRDLFDLVRRNGALPEKVAKHLFLEILEGVHHLHSNSQIAHLDLKLENVLIGNSFEAKICDFGFYQELKNKVKSFCGTHGYRAPETYIESIKEYEGDKADIFSLGVILFILLFGVPPFCSATKEDSLYRYFCRGPNGLKFFFRLHPSTKHLYGSGSLDMDLMDLLYSLLEEDPSKRIQSVA